MYNSWRIRSMCCKQRSIWFFMMYNTWRIRSMSFKQRRIWFFMMHNSWRIRSMCFELRRITFVMMFNTWNMRSMGFVKNQDMWFVKNSYPLRPSSNPLRDPLHPSQNSYLNRLLSCNLSQRNGVLLVFHKEMLFYMLFTKKCNNKYYFTFFHGEMLYYLYFTKKCYFIVVYFLEKMRYCTCTLYLCTLVAVRTPMGTGLTGLSFSH